MSNKLYFKVEAQNQNVYQLWRTDGTGLGTSMVKDFGAKNFWSNMVVLNGQLYFMTKYFDPVWGNVVHELWKSDGTSNGTIVVKDWVNSTSFNGQTNIVYFKNKIFFSGFESDGSTSGTIQTGVNLPNESISCLYNGLLYYCGSDGKIWKTDGTVAGTTKAVDFPVTDKIFVFNGFMYFSGGYTGAGQTGYELCRTDGTLANTIVVKDIYFGYNSSSPSEFIALNGALYFFANDGIHGNELWKTDGTTFGTVLVKDINIGTYGIYTRNQVIHNNELYFNVFRYSNANYRGIWKTDGTETNTVLVKSVDSTGTMIDINCKLFVSFDTLRFDQFGNYMDNSELWGLVENCQSTDIHEVTNSDNLVMYPNPTADIIKVRLDNFQTHLNYEIYDQFGKILIQSTFEANENQVDLSHLNSGIYFLKIEGVSALKKIIKN
jgi:ELWxxDGT repeat protein